MLEVTAPRDATLRAPRVPLFPIAATGIGYVAPDGARLLSGVSLRLDAGRRTMVMGPNGAGKSLLLRVLHGLIQPTEGAVTWAGSAPNDAVRARQAMVFQRATLLRRSAEANIRFVLSGLPREEAAERTVAALARARLTHVAANPARLLSGGEQQRLAIARALALEPDVLFLDEPCASLDPASTAAVEDMVETAHAEGTRIVLVTHDIGQARRLADDVVFMHAGRLAEHTTADRFFAEPASAGARDYLAGRIPR